MPNHCYFVCVSIQQNCVWMCAWACTARYFCCQTNHLCSFIHSLQYCYVYLSDWLFYSGFWVNQSPSSSSSSSFFGYCLWYSVPDFLFPLPPLWPSNVDTKAKSKLTWFMFQCAEVCSLCSRICVICTYVCLITLKSNNKTSSILLYIYYIQWTTEWVKSK